MGRHATPSAYSRRRGAASRRQVATSTSGRILVAAVAAGAALPAAQTLDTHTADANGGATTAELSSADISLATEHGPAVRPAAHHGAPATPGPSAARPGWSSVSPVTPPRTGRSGASSTGAAAGDADDVASLTKSISISRENGPLEFGRPYSAGDDDDLDGQISKALGLMGLPQKLAPGVKKIIMKESTGNPDAINDWDSNAASGTPSKGLMQLIDTTFDNAVLPSLHDKGIYDPVANITAGVRTMIANHDIEDVMNGGRRGSGGGYVGYGGAKLPTDGLGRASD